MLQVLVTSAFDTKVNAQLSGVKLENGGELDVQAGRESNMTYTCTGHHGNSASQGSVTIDGFEPVPISIAQNRSGQTFISSKGRWRVLLLCAPAWDWKNGGEKPSAGQAAEIEICGTACCSLTLKMQIRSATELELRRCLQLQALREAEQ